MFLLIVWRRLSIVLIFMLIILRWWSIIRIILVLILLLLIRRCLIEVPLKIPCSTSHRYLVTIILIKRVLSSILMSSYRSLFNSIISIICHLILKLTIILVIFLIFLKGIIFKVIRLITLSSTSNWLILKSIVWIIGVMLRSVILLRRRRWWWKTTSIGYNCPVICFEFAIPRKTHIICTANLSLLFFQVWQPLTLDLVLHSHLLCYSRYRR